MPLGCLLVQAGRSHQLLHPGCYRRCLEVGSGSGYVITSLGLLLQQLGMAVQLLATDINQQAAAATAATLAAHGVRALGRCPASSTRGSCVTCSRLSLAGNQPVSLLASQPPRGCLHQLPAVLPAHHLQTASQLALACGCAGVES